MVNLSDCPYCSNICNPADAGAKPRSPFDEILDFGPGVVLVPTLGMIVPGYLLVVSRTHAPDFAHWEAGALELLERFVAARVADLERLFGSYVIFEHGSGHRVAPSGSCIDHAHLHLLPGDAAFANHIEHAFEWSNLAGLADLTRFRSAPYALFGSGGRYRAAPIGELPSQWIRREFAGWIKTEVSWDWAVYPGGRELEATRSQLESSGLRRAWGTEGSRLGSNRK